MSDSRAVVLVALLGFPTLAPADSVAGRAVVGMVVDPASVRLEGPNAVQSLLVHGQAAKGGPIDLTHAVKYRSLDPEVATVSPTGLIGGVSDGSTVIVVEAPGVAVVEVRVSVAGARRPRRYHFENDIVPILSKLGCNASGCHGKAEGQNGFKLSVFGYDPAADYAALTQESRGRRVFPAAPERSLFLTKISGGVPHGGGLRCSTGSEDYETLRGWIAAGMPFGAATAPHVVSIRVEPRERQLDLRCGQQLRVTARYSDGHETDVTRHAKFQSNNEGLASVDEQGLVTSASTPGEVAVMAAYMGAVDTFQAIVPRPGAAAVFPDWPNDNVIDTLVLRKLRKLNIAPSEPGTDADFLRRVFLDVIGTLPTAEEARRFLNDRRPDRRARLVDELLCRPEYADYWALKWADLLRVDRVALGHKYAYAFYRWLREAIAAGMPYDRFARAVLTAEGPLAESGPASFYKTVSKPGDAASTLSQVFLGVRIACAECHHHPFDRWSQTDYYGMQAFFTPVGVRSTAQGDAVCAADAPVTRHPRTGAVVFAHALGTPMTEAPLPGDRRLVLSDWMTAPENPWFARNLANRLWAHFLGRGLIDPVDDVRATNPPTNPELLDALARHLVDHQRDTRSLIRLITSSRVYQLSSRPNETNARDEQNHSRALFKRIDAEVLLDMVCQTTGVAEKFAGVPPGSRAVQLWDSQVAHDFLKMFGRPQRVSACQCERVVEPTAGQVLHVLNSPRVQTKLSHEAGTVARLVRRCREDGPLVDELYLTFFSRFPSEDESAVAVGYLRDHASQRQQAAEDLAWSLLNSLEFLFNH
jgi:hypothetical protein